MHPWCMLKMMFMLWPIQGQALMVLFKPSQCPRMGRPFKRLRKLSTIPIRAICMRSSATMKIPSLLSIEMPVTMGF